MMVSSVLAGSIPASAATAKAAPSDPVMYDSTVSPLPPSLPSLGFEANAIVEFGNKIMLAEMPEPLGSVTLTLESGACQSGHGNDGTCVTAAGATFS
jgi:hypothetical protein